MQRFFSQHDRFRWIWNRVLLFLDPVDARRLVAAALENRVHTYAPFAQRLLHGNAPFVPLETEECVDEAAQFACWTVTEMLLRKLPSWIRGKGDLRAQANDSSLQAAAARSDFAAVWWLLQVTDYAPAAGMKQPPLTNVHDVALRAVVEARQLGMVDWLVTYSERIECVVPYDTTLQVIVRGDAFAGDGDLEMLETLKASSTSDDRHPRLFSPRAMKNAARSGHLHVGKWLYKRFPLDFDSHVLDAAAGHRHLERLQWVFHQGVPRTAFAGCNAATARFGHLDVLRWLKSFGLISRIGSPLPSHYAITRAIEGGHLETVRFLHEECRVPFAQSRHLESGLGSCPDVHTAAYVLDKYTGRPLGPASIIDVAAAQSPNVSVVHYYVL